MSLPKAKTVWPSGLRRWLKAPVRKGVGSNPTAVISQRGACCLSCASQRANEARGPGTWCSGITPAQHAGGPGFNPQCVHILSPQLLAYSVAMLQGAWASQRLQMTAVGFEPTPLRTGAWSQRLRPLGQTVLGQACAHVCGMRFASRRGFARRRTRPMHNTWSHAGLNRGPYGYWPYALTS